ncbi:MAG: hypothetical protein Q8Q95_01995 [bacterium]|nr:hypothetical protein [bacterium]
MNKPLYQRKLPKDSSHVHSSESFISFLESLDKKEWIVLIDDLAMESIRADSLLGFSQKSGFGTLVEIVSFFRRINENSLINLVEAIKFAILKGIRKGSKNRNLRYKNIQYLIRVLELKMDTFPLLCVVSMVGFVDIKIRRGFAKCVDRLSQ